MGAVAGIVAGGALVGGAASIYASNSQASAARHAANAQKAAAGDSIAFQRESRDLARDDLQPFREAGESTLGGLQDMVNNPVAQRDYVLNNPFFDAISERATQTLMANSATGGRINAGDTKELLHSNLMRIGSDLVNQNITQRSNLASLGANAAAGQATITQNAANSIGNTMVGAGNAQAAGIMGAANAKAAGIQNIGNIGSNLAGQATPYAMMACDRRLKENIKEVGQLNNGLPLYMFNYIGDSKMYINVMAQDVEEVNPDAVSEINGYKHINMEQVCQ